jgi:hypothetical protein
VFKKNALFPYLAHISHTQQKSVLQVIREASLPCG